MSEVFELINEELARIGVKDVFGLPGEDTIEWIASLPKVGITYRGTRHEGTAVAMADGYSWATDSLGVCTVSRGPGLTNASSALREAVSGKRRVLLVIGDTPLFKRGPWDRKNMDQKKLTEATGAGFFQTTSPELVPTVLRQAIASAMTGKPAVFAVSSDVLVSDRGNLVSEPPAKKTDVRMAWAPATNDIEEIVRMIERSSRPVILAGRGADSPECHEQLVKLGDQIGALLGTTLPMKGNFFDSPYNLGIVGGFVSDPCVSLLGEIDLLLAFGASLNQFTTANRTLFKRAEIVQIDVDPASLGANYPITLGLACDSLIAAKHISQALTGNVRSRPTPFRTKAVLDQLKLPVWEGDDISTADEIDPRALIAALDKILPKERVAVIEGGQMATAPGRYMPVQRPRAMRNSAESGSIGMGLGVGLGAALGRPERPCVLFAGDGSFSMALADLETAVRHNIPLIMVILNDRAYMAEAFFLRAASKPTEAADLPDMDFAAIAKAFGIEAITISSPQELASLDPAMFRRRTPLLINCRVSKGYIIPRVEWN